MNVNLSNAIRLVNSQQFTKAVIEIKTLLKEHPHNYDLNKLMGMSLMAQRKYNSAINFFQICYDQNQNDFEVLLNLSFIFLKVQFYEYSIDFANRALKIKPEEPGSYQNLSSCYLFLKKFDLAKKYAENAINLRGGFDSEHFLKVTDLISLYADILLAIKDYGAFVDYCLKILNYNYNSDLMIRLLRHDKSFITSDHLKSVESVIKNYNNVTDKISRHNLISSAHFILAEYYTKSDQKKSESHYILANGYIAEMQRQSIFNRQKICRAIIKFFKDFNYTEIVNSIAKNKGDGVVFILGMPRSGTTLTESIISTADDVRAGGEKSFFSLQLANEIKKIVSGDTSSINKDFFLDIGDRYLNHIELERENKKYFLDKLPENYLFYKFIKIALPGAKFINCYRDPWDNAISLFKQNYSINIYYASSFFGIATEYANYKNIIQFWKMIDGEDFALDLKYEDVVLNTELAAKKIWDHCQLDGVYSEQKRKGHFGYTASMQQVTQNIYSSSIKKEEFLSQKDEFLGYLKDQEDYWANSSR